MFCTFLENFIVTMDVNVFDPWLFLPRNSMHTRGNGVMERGASMTSLSSGVY